MTYFRARGLWFLDEDPKNRVAGTLRYSERGIHLNLLGGFTGSWGPQTARYPLIRGVVSKTPYGEFVTLIDCFTRRTKLSSVGTGSETIYCNGGIVGDAHLPPHYDDYE